MNVTAIIPARYSSVRFEGKPLVQIKGIPMIQHVYERVMKCPVVERTLVATDDERIYNTVKDFHGEAIMTSRPIIRPEQIDWQRSQQRLMPISL